MHDSCEIEVTGLNITIQPKKRVENGEICTFDPASTPLNLLIYAMRVPTKKDAWLKSF